jgi:hypothetical protein
LGTVSGGSTVSLKPKALLFRDALATAEQRIVDALPDIIDGLITRAREGDLKAAVYLCDRIMGRAAGSAVPPANDRRPPYTEEAFRLDEEEREENDGMRRLLAGFGAGKGA